MFRSDSYTPQNQQSTDDRQKTSEVDLSQLTYYRTTHPKKKSSFAPEKSSFKKVKTSHSVTYSNTLKLNKQDSERPQNKHLEDSDIAATLIEIGQNLPNSRDRPTLTLNPNKQEESIMNDNQSFIQEAVNLPHPKENEDDFEEEVNDEKEELKIADEENKIMSTTGSDKSKVTMSIFEYIRSFFSKDETLMKKKQILSEGRKRIEERLNVFNVIKKMREIDKLKFLLLDQHQLALFENLPRPVLEQESRRLLTMKTTAVNGLVQGTFVREIQQNQLAYSYRYIKYKENKTPLDEKLLQIYGELSTI